MTAIHVDTSELSQCSAGWFSNAPTEFSAPPIATPAADPISAAALAVLADWPAVHETLTGTRSTKAAELTGANSATAEILNATDGDNAALITNSAGS
jgi:hypothetical protein